MARNDFYQYKNISMSASEKSVDAVFIEDMIPHHEGAIVMAELALTKAKTNEVRTLATEIISAQQEEITTMKAWYTTWFGKYIPINTTTTMSVHGTAHDMVHMESMSGNTEKLENAENFDKEFLEQMIPHHEMAIMMAQTLLRTTSRNEMESLAENIINAQSAEIAQMRAWLAEWE